MARGEDERSHQRPVRKKREKKKISGWLCPKEPGHRLVRKGGVDEYANPVEKKKGARRKENAREKRIAGGQKT